MSRPVVAALIASVFAMYGLLDRTPVSNADRPLRAWEYELTGLSAGLSGQSSGTRIQHRGPERTLGFRLHVVGPGGENLHEELLGSVHDDRPLVLDHVVVASLDDLQRDDGESQLLTIRLSSLSGDQRLLVRTFVDRWLPRGAAAVQTSTGRAQSVPASEEVTVFDCSLPDGRGSLQVACFVES